MQTSNDEHMIGDFNSQWIPTKHELEPNLIAVLVVGSAQSDGQVERVAPPDHQRGVDIVDDLILGSVMCFAIISREELNANHFVGRRTSYWLKWVDRISIYRLSIVLDLSEDFISDTFDGNAFGLILWALLRLFGTALA